MRIDLHTHSLVSDGTDRPADLVARAREAGLDVVGLTDHDSGDGWAEAVAAGRRLGVVVVPGIELSAHEPVPGEAPGALATDRRAVHVLGYGVDPTEPALAADLAAIGQGRRDRIPKMLAQLAALGLPLTVDEVRAQAGDAVIGRPHVADALVARGYARHRDEVFARWLRDDGPIRVRRFTPDVGRAVDLVVGAGGLAVLAHPWARGGQERLTVRRIEELVAEHGLAGLEADHPDHEADQRAALRRLAERLGLLATGSSDYHGLGKRGHPLGACTTSEEVWSRLRAKLTGTRHDLATTTPGREPAAEGATGPG